MDFKSQSKLKIVPLGTRVKLLRQLAGLNQQELAHRVGIAQPSLSEIEANKTDEIKASTLMALAEALKVTPEYLWYGK